jgi:hypothetical protein
MKRWAALGIVGFIGFAYFVGCKDQVNPEFPQVGAEPTDPESTGEGDEQELTDGSASDASTSNDDAEAPLTGQCASTFGDKLTDAFGRIDGVVSAVQKPSDTECTLPNDDHVVVQVKMNGAVYRLVVNVKNTRPGPDGAPPPPLHLATIQHAMPAPAFQEGWHTGVKLDYPSSLDVHSDDAAFQPKEMDELVSALATELKIGAKVSIYATSQNQSSSAHLVHRIKNDQTDNDGAIVVSPTSKKSTKFLLFRFADQVF